MNNKILLWLDDCRDPFENPDWLVFSPIGKDVDVIWVQSYTEFTNWIISNGLPDGICFDHDLGDEIIGESIDGKSGMDCAKWLVNYCMDNNLNIPPYNVQSANPVGKENIISLLENFKKTFDIEKETVVPINKFEEEHDKFLRLSADFQNYKRITENRIDAMKSQSGKEMILEFLPILDDLTLSIESGNKDNQLILNKALETLKKHGVEPYGVIHDEFNSDIHNCFSLSHMSDVADGAISCVYRQGYTMNGEVIRHADVIVNKNN